MRIDRLDLQNFKKYERLTLELDPHFTLLVGENGAGKTSVLDALAVALGIWLVDYPDTTLANSGRNILPNEIRLQAAKEGDRVQFHEQRPVVVTAVGQIAARDRLPWTRQIRPDGQRTSNADAKDALDEIRRVFEAVEKGEKILCPILGYYGAGRAWLPSRERKGQEAKGDFSRRWAAFYDCFNERIRFSELTEWFRREALASVNRGGRMRPGFEVVRRALLRCMPDAENVYFDGDFRKDGEIMLTIRGETQPFGNLSAGQRMMFALVADLAIKAVTQNNHLVPEDALGEDDEPWPRVLRETPGVVLIDELDVHLHPKWQRRAVDDLRAVFPALQFVATSHSPFIIQAAGSGKIVKLDKEELVETEEAGGQKSLRPLTVGVEPAGESIEDIAEDVQGVETPQQSARARKLAETTEAYFSLLRQGERADSAVLSKAEAEYRQASEPFASEPGLNAILKLEALASLKDATTAKIAFGHAPRRILRNLEIEGGKETPGTEAGA